MAHACARAQGIFFFVCNRWSATITEDRPRQFLFDTDLVLIHCSQTTLPRLTPPLNPPHWHPPINPRIQSAQRPPARVQSFVMLLTFKQWIAIKRHSPIAPSTRRYIPRLQPAGLYSGTAHKKGPRTYRNGDQLEGEARY